MIIVECPGCGERFRIKPAFMVSGTILTLLAILLVSFLYESSLDEDTSYSWRTLTDKLTSSDMSLAHSTLYTACHALGKSVSKSDLKALIVEYGFIFSTDDHVEASWSTMRSIYEHTKMREFGLRRILTVFKLSLAKNCSSLISLLLNLTTNLSVIIKNNKFNILQLYPQPP